MILDLLNKVLLETGLGDVTTPSGTETPTQNPTNGGLFGGQWWTIILYVVIFGAIFYFLLYRPQKKKDKEKKNMLENMKKGDKITTIGGISGKIASIKDDTIVLEVASIGGAEKVKIEIQRWAVGSVDKVSDEVIDTSAD